MADQSVPVAPATTPWAFRSVSSMMLSGEGDRARSEPYRVPRGTCPKCGSSDVIHLIIGLPMDPEAGAGDPDWVHWIGCVHPGYARECITCGSNWIASQAEPAQPSQPRRTFPAPLPRPYRRAPRP